MSETKETEESLNAAECEAFLPTNDEEHDVAIIPVNHKTLCN